MSLRQHFLDTMSVCDIVVQQQYNSKSEMGTQTEIALKIQHGEQVDETLGREHCISLTKAYPRVAV